MKRLPLFLLLLMSGLFLFGLAQLFRLRFEAGDVYPEYSSLRADPLGTKAFYESLQPLLEVRRNFRPFSKLGDGRDTTLFYLGSRGAFMFNDQSDLRLSPEEFKNLESFVSDGGRLVISFFPTFQKPSTNRFRPKPASDPSSPADGRQNKGERPTVTPPKGPLDGDEEFSDFRTISVRERWGLQYNYAELLKDDNNTYKAEPAVKAADGRLPEVVSCHTALFFDKLTNSWQVVYARQKNRPVIIKRKLGTGSIVLSADSYLFSNEALWKERSPELLAWMAGPNRRVLFDETHLGVEESSGISALARKYRLHGLFAGLLLLAGLFVWKNSTSFMPPYAEQTRREEDELISGKDSAAGFVNLLRRNLPAREVLGVCLAEWKKSCSRQQSQTKLQQVQTLIDSENAKPPGDRKPVEEYRAIQRIFETRNSKLETEE